jgi:hypothetical protein
MIPGGPEESKDPYFSPNPKIVKGWKKNRPIWFFTDQGYRPGEGKGGSNNEKKPVKGFLRWC